MKLFGHFIQVEGAGILSSKRKKIVEGVLKKVGSDRLLSMYKSFNAIRDFEKKKYEVVFPCNFSHSVTGPLRFTNIDMEIHGFSFLKDNFIGRQMHDVLDKDELLKKEVISYVIFNQEAFDEFDAIDQANNRIELFRSLLNFYKSFGNNAKETCRPSYLSSIHPPKYVFVFDDKKNFITMSGVFGDYDYKPVNFSKQEITEVESLVHKVNCIGDYDLKYLLFKALIQHTDALDEVAPEAAFSEYWKVLEVLSLGNEDGIEGPEACLRLKSLFVDKEACPVRRLYRKLDDPSKISSNDLNNIKSVAQETIMFLFNNSETLGGKEGLLALYKKNQTKLLPPKPKKRTPEKKKAKKK
ncbi:hypothetical protein COT47_02105 [Candidatus Woesearchaeota archaeon CG08_land_8_20_14_0_20_43_7]|nr:MAG: hypothetical protein COT47_02105 [Candidatus Woesearchaeota archaeon CG08_land_8_20_14_0_20_43_7]